jgi:hypothetical protein
MFLDQSESHGFYLKNIDFLRFSWLLKEKNNLSAEAYSH